MCFLLYCAGHVSNVNPLITRSLELTVFRAGLRVVVVIVGSRFCSGRGDVDSGFRSDVEAIPLVGRDAGLGGDSGRARREV